MRRAIVSLLLALAFVAASAPTPSLAAASSEDGLCRLLTVKEVRKALGKGKWQIAKDGDVPDQCYMHNGLMDRKSRAFSMRLLASNEENQQEFRDDVVASGARELTVAGFPAVQDGRDAVTVFFPDPWDILQLSPVGYEDDDIAKGIRQLAELATARFAGVDASPAVSPAVPSGNPGGAADPCALLTAEEITAAIGGEPMTVSPEHMPGHCTYLDQGGRFLEVVVDVAPTMDISMIEQRRTFMPDLTDLEVAGLPALSLTSAEGRSQTVFVYPSDAVELTFSLQTVGAADALPALTALAELGTARAMEAGLPVPPTPEPSSPGAATGDGLCAILSADEASAALGGATVKQAFAEADGCAYLGDGSEAAVYLEVLRGDRAAEMHQQIGTIPDHFEVAGMPAAQAEMPPASIVVLVPDDATAVQLTVGTPKGVDATAAARALTELVAPRVKGYLGL